jgi:hypothetical protein
LFFIAAAMLTTFIWFVGKIEHREFSRLPMIGRFYRTRAVPAEPIPPNYP